MKKAPILLILFFPVLSALAEPKYIECIYIDEKKVTNKFEVKLDEDNGKISHTSNNGSAFNADGFFKSNEVTYQKVISIADGDALIKKIYKINRTDLSFTYDMVFEPIAFKDKLETTTHTESGSCELLKIKKQLI